MFVKSAVIMMNNIVLQRCLFYMYMHFLNLKISFPFCSLKFTHVRYTVRGDQ